MNDYARVEAMIRHLEANRLSQPSLGELAEAAGLGETQVHRLFRRWAGLTPKEFLQCLTLEDAKRQEVPTGATGGSTSSQYPKAMNALLGTKFKIITGYPGGNEINLALEKGEVAVRGSNAWGSWKATRPDWLRDNKINLLVQIGLTKAPDLPDVPLLIDLAKNEEDRAVLMLLSASVTIGRPLYVAPGVPAERVRALREAFNRMVKDTVFTDAARREGFEINPVSGEEMQKIVSQIIATPRPIADRLSQIIGGVEQNTGHK